MTTFVESFNKSDSDILGPDNTWTEDTGDADIVSNRARAMTGGAVIARVSGNLGSPDHFSQATIRVNSIDLTGAIGIMVRKAGSATQTFYLYDVLVSTGVNLARAYKCVDTTFTQLTADVDGAILIDTDYVLKLSIIGSQYTATKDGVQTHSLTDTSITGTTTPSVGNLQVGLRGDENGSGIIAEWDNFSAVGGKNKLRYALPTKCVQRRSVDMAV